MEPPDADAYFGKVLRDTAKGTRLSRAQALKTYFLLLELRHKVEIHHKASGADSKYIAALLGHARSSFTDDVYVTLFPEVAKATAEAAAAIVPRSGQAQ
jgi:integrase